MWEMMLRRLRASDLPSQSSTSTRALSWTSTSCPSPACQDRLLACCSVCVACKGLGSTSALSCTSTSCPNPLVDRLLSVGCKDT